MTLGEKGVDMSTSSRDAMARGNIPAWIESMGPDQHESWSVDIDPIGGVRGSLSRIGQTLILVTSHGDVMVHVEPTQESAQREYAAKSTQFRDGIARMIAAQGQGPEALVDAVMAFLGVQPADDEQTVPMPVGRAVGTAPVRYVDAGPGDLPTGLYL